MRQLLKESGCDTLEGYLDITHALSLIDTFWVKLSFERDTNLNLPEWRLTYLEKFVRENIQKILN